MQRQSDQVAPIFAAMFRRNPIERVLRFLDEVGAPAGELPIDSHHAAEAIVRADAVAG